MDSYEKIANRINFDIVGQIVQNEAILKILRAKYSSDTDNLELICDIEVLVSEIKYLNGILKRNEENLLKRRKLNYESFMYTI